MSSESEDWSRFWSASVSSRAFTAITHTHTHPRCCGMLRRMPAEDSRGQLKFLSSSRRLQTTHRPTDHPPAFTSDALCLRLPDVVEELFGRSERLSAVVPVVSACGPRCAAHQLSSRSFSSCSGASALLLTGRTGSEPVPPYMFLCPALTKCPGQIVTPCSPNHMAALCGVLHGGHVGVPAALA